MNCDVLKEKISKSSFTNGEIAQKLGLSRQSLHKKVSGKIEFRASEMFALSTVLGLSEAEFCNIFLHKE